MKKLASFSALLYLLFYVFAAPVQYLAALSGTTYILTAAKVGLPILIILIGIIYMFSDMKIPTRIFGLFVILAFSILVSIYNQLSLIQIGYGIKSYLPFFAYALYFAYLSEKPNFVKMHRIITPLVVLGILWDKFAVMPWQDMTFLIGDVERSVSRSWETFGVERLAGFQNASYDAAVVLAGLLCLYFIDVFVFSKDYKKRRYLDIFLFFFSAYAIYLTTFKSAYLYLFALIIFVILAQVRNKLIIDTVIAIKLLVLSTFAYCLLPPMIAYFGGSLVQIKDSNYLINYIFKSYGIRMDITWPDAISLLNTSAFNGFLGRGIGGLGTAQQYGEPSLYNSGDNIFVFLLVTVGILVVPIILSLIKSIFSMNFMYSTWFIMFSLLILMFCIGATANIIDSPLLMSLLGAMLSIYTKQVANFKKINNDNPANLQRNKFYVAWS